MLSAEKFKKLSHQKKMSVEQLADSIIRAGLSKKQALSAVKNWQKGLLKPAPRKDDIQKLADALAVEVNDISHWKSIYRYAPGSPRKARLVTQLIVGRGVQDAMDILSFTGKRAADMVNKTLKSAIANADEQQADVDNLFVTEARVDDAGIRIGTKRWIAKDRGRAVPMQRKACHIHVTVTEA